MALEIDDSIQVVFKKVPISKPVIPDFDCIVLSSSACYGNCPVMNIRIDKSGRGLYEGRHYNQVNGYYSFEIPRSGFDSILMDFGRADIGNLENLHSSNQSDGQTVTVTFIKDHKIVKTILDYGNKGPREFIRAYTQLRFFYLRYPLVAISETDFSYPLRNVTDLSRNLKLSMVPSESFLLLTELNSPQVRVTTSTDIKFKYTIDYGENQKVYTDGRFYKLDDKTLDLGYNFFETIAWMEDFTKNQTIH